MAHKKAHEVDAWLARPDPDRPIVLIYGPDRGLVAERARLLAAGSGIPLDDPFSVVRVDAAGLEASPGRLLDEARTVPMFAPRRLIWIADAGAQKHLAQELATLAAEPPPNALILIEAGDLKKGAPLRTGVENAQTGMALPCFADNGRAVDTVIDEMLGAEKMTITLEARQLLRANLGGDRLATRGEIAKLVLYCLGRTQIDSADVAAVIGDVSDLSPDDVVDAVLAHRIPVFDDAFRRAIAGGTHPFQLLAACLRHFQQMQVLRAGMDSQRKSAAAAVASARPPVFFARRPAVEAALQAWDAAALAQAAARLQHAVLETRRRADLAQPIARQSLLALAAGAAASPERRKTAG